MMSREQEVYNADLAKFSLTPDMEFKLTPTLWKAPIVKYMKITTFWVALAAWFNLCRFDPHYDVSHSLASFLFIF